MKTFLTTLFARALAWHPYNHALYAEGLRDGERDVRRGTLMACRGGTKVVAPRGEAAYVRGYHAGLQKTPSGKAFFMHGARHAGLSA